MKVFCNCCGKPYDPNSIGVNSVKCETCRTDKCSCSKQRRAA